VVVFPFVPVIAEIGIRAGDPAGKSIVITGPATSRDVPSAGATRSSDLRCEEVHTGYVQTDRPGGPDGHLPVVRVHDVGHIHGCAARRQVARRAQVDEASRLRNAVARQASRRQQPVGLVIELDPGQHLLVTDPAPRIPVQRFDQLFDRAPAVSDDVTGNPLRHRDQRSIDDEHPMVEALDKALDEDRSSVSLRLFEGGADLVGLLEIDGDPPPMVGTQRLQHDRIADLLGRVNRLLDAVHQPLRGHGQPELAQDPVGLIFV